MPAAVKGKTQLVAWKPSLFPRLWRSPGAEHVSVSEIGWPSFLFPKQANQPHVVNHAVAVSIVTVRSPYS